jgi:hypothetical protein
VHPRELPASALVAELVGAGVPVERVTPGRRLEDAFLALIAEPGNGRDAAFADGTRRAAAGTDASR